MAVGTEMFPLLGRGNRHLNIDIAHEVVPEVVTHIHLFNLSILLLQFCEYLLQKMGNAQLRSGTQETQLPWQPSPQRSYHSVLALPHRSRDLVEGRRVK